jgi:mycothiol synthase
LSIEELSVQSKTIDGDYFLGNLTMHENFIEISNAPPIAGLCFRRFRGAEDFPKMLAVFVASTEADKIEIAKTLEDLTHDYAHLENCNPGKDMIFAEIYGQVIGYLRGYWWDELKLGRRYAHISFLAPHWRRKGIGTALLNWIENHFREIATEHPPAIAKEFQAVASQFQVGATSLLKRSGYQPIRYFEQMVRPTLDNIPNFPLPDGLSIRAALPEHYRVIWKTVEETFRDCWGCAEFTEESYQTWLDTKSRFQPHLWQIAWDDTTDRIVGHVLTFIDLAENEKYQRQRGYTEVIGVCRAWRKQGVARALISRSLQAQKAEGMTESALGVDTESPSGANHLYKYCGFQVVKRNTVFSKPLRSIT